MPYQFPVRHGLRALSLTAATFFLLATAPSAGAVGFQRFGLSTAGMGLANAMGADAEHVSSMAYNPSALAFQEGAHSQVGFMRRYGRLEAPTGKTSPEANFYAHDIYATYRGAGSPLGVGLGVNRPFRMDSDFSGDFSSPFAATRTQLDLIDVNPALAYKLRPDLAVSLGADYYRALDFEYSSLDATGSSEVARTGDGGGWGGTAGLMFWREGWSVAATYKSGADLEMEGKNLPGNNFHLPARARVGLKVRPTLRWSVHLDAVRTSWSRYNGLEDVPGELEKDWQDTMGYRLGGMYRFSDKVALRFGYSYDEDPKDELTFDPRSASGDRHMLTLGGGWEGDLLRFNLAYAYAFDTSRKVRGAAVPEYDGTHRTKAQFLLFSVGYSDW